MYTEKAFMSGFWDEGLAGISGRVLDGGGLTIALYMGSCWRSKATSFQHPLLFFTRNDQDNETTPIDARRVRFVRIWEIGRVITL